ncbi:hypothetical protein H8B09_22995 [Paenibacillus sp. PR3]|uniref:Mor transcription activator domain-containing protein n=1 Tax=Paenibacillus terricola TaxID=2763503 RepID=A0ABR8N1B6_9BACL|nr:CD3324 family protein [Paenibacillus terricola]MBD3921655.1 hypothetical protein [Paenibacillus terricola]
MTNKHVSYKILPIELLSELQKYVQGELIYIPKPSGSRTRWGENSGYRARIHERNNEITCKYKQGIPLDHLAEEYCLSLESIKKIVYRKQ